MRPIAILAGTVATATLVAACGSTGGSKVGANTHRTRTLVFEVPDDGDPPAQVFIDEVKQETHGRLRVQHDLASPYTSALPANELRLVHAVETGKVAVAYIPARAFAAARLPEFQALLAPFVLSTDDASRAFAQSPLAGSVLQSLPRSLVGLGVVPQEARRILATTPPTSAAALRGLRIRIVDNPQTAADMRAVGARPVQGLAAKEATALLLRHRLDGVESNVDSILNNGYETVARYFSTYSPFPKFQVIVVNRGVWDSLPSAQQSALRAAAGDAVASAAQLEPFDEQQELTELCQADGRPATPTHAQLAQIAKAMRATTPRSVTGPGGKELLAQLLRLPGTGVRTLATPLPDACTNPPKTTPFVHRGGATIPLGVYTVTDTAQDWLDGHVINKDMRTAITYVTTFRKNGTWYQTQTPNYPDQGPFEGTYTVHADQLTMVMTHAGPPNHPNDISAPETVQWSYFDGKLTLRNLVVADPASRVLYAAHPWRKIR